MNPIYKGIEFQIGLSLSQSDFNKLFGNCSVFRNLSENNKKIELEIAYKIATASQTKLAVKSVEPSKTVIKNGNAKRTTKPRKKPKT